MVTPQALNVRVGDPLRLEKLIVIALDAKGRVLERIPLAFMLEGPARLFDFEGFRTDGTEIVATGPGRATIWVEAALPTTAGQPLRVPIAVTVR